MLEQIALASTRFSWPAPWTRRDRGERAEAGGAARRRPAAAPLAAEAAGRDVVCLLGLPFDAVTTAEAAARVRAAVQARRRLFVSTPNVHYLIGCQRDAAFRASVVDSDLSVADGMPLVWMSRLLGTPLPERVTGAGLFERLRDEPLPPGCAPIRVYFFGGPPGAAEAAAQRVNARSSAMVCVGYESPGFGSVEDLSRPEMLERINASGADFLVVALGATKGQAWLQRNRERLQPPVISHLGAVVNFAAGTVRRAPVGMQRAGLEWLWRIKEEPALWRRYGRDACALLGLVAAKLLPHLLWRRLRRATDEGRPATAAVSLDGQGIRLRIAGVVADAVPDAVAVALRECGQAARPVALDLGAVTHFGPTFAGALLRLARETAAAGQTLRLVGASRQARRLLRWNGVDALLERGHSVPAPGA